MQEAYLSWRVLAWRTVRARAVHVDAEEHLMHSLWLYATPAHALRDMLHAPKLSHDRRRAGAARFDDYGGSDRPPTPPASPSYVRSCC